MREWLHRSTALLALAAVLHTAPVRDAGAQPIRHDAEHYVLLHQYAEQWAAEVGWRP